ncbi:MAG: DUF1573 domain-containing protein [Syntrophaceae bacterium]
MRRTLAVFLVLLAALLIGYGAYLVKTRTAALPEIFVPEEIFTFSPVLDGQEVRHDFVVLNNGTSPLELIEVKTDCGCTTVSYPGQIPPGGKGNIATKLATKGYGGDRVTRTMVIRTNDRKRPEINLVLVGEVKPLADIVPPEARLTGTVGRRIRQTVEITPTHENPFKIVGVRAEKGEHIRYDLTETGEPGGRTYHLNIYNMKREKGWYIDNISLQTDSVLSPVLKVRVFGLLRDGP